MIQSLLQIYFECSEMIRTYKCATQRKPHGSTKAGLKNLLYNVHCKGKMRANTRQSKPEKRPSCITYEQGDHKHQPQKEIYPILAS